MTSELVPLHLTFGELKRVAGLLGCPDATEIWVASAALPTGSLGEHYRMRVM